MFKKQDKMVTDVTVSCLSFNSPWLTCPQCVWLPLSHISSQPWTCTKGPAEGPLVLACTVRRQGKANTEGGQRAEA